MAANGGNLFLDEIGDLPLSMQAKLLRVLQEKVITGVGSNNTVNVNVRIIAATHKDLAQMVKEGKFREDLYYRLNIIKINVSSLRERKKDIPILVEHFLKSMKASHLKINKDAMEFLMENH